MQNCAYEIKIMTKTRLTTAKHIQTDTSALPNSENTLTRHNLEYFSDYAHSAIISGSLLSNTPSSIPHTSGDACELGYHQDKDGVRHHFIMTTASTLNHPMESNIEPHEISSNLVQNLNKMLDEHFIINSTNLIDILLTVAKNTYQKTRNESLNESPEEDTLNNLSEYLTSMLCSVSCTLVQRNDDNTLSCITANFGNNMIFILDPETLELKHTIHPQDTTNQTSLNSYNKISPQITLVSIQENDIVIHMNKAIWEPLEPFDFKTLLDKVARNPQAIAEHLLKHTSKKTESSNKNATISIIQIPQHALELTRALISPNEDQLYCLVIRLMKERLTPQNQLYLLNCLAQEKHIPREYAYGSRAPHINYQASYTPDQLKPARLFLDIAQCNNASLEKLRRNKSETELDGRSLSPAEEDAKWQLTLQNIGLIKSLQAEPRKREKQKLLINTLNKSKPALSSFDRSILFNVIYQNMPELNEHTHPLRDRILGLNNTQSWRLTLHSLRKHATKQLWKDIEEEKHTQNKIALLSHAKQQTLFTMQRNNYTILGAFGRTHTVNLIEKQLKYWEKALKDELEEKSINRPESPLD